jgi:hypothetical protein
MANDITLPGTGVKVDTVELVDGSHQQVVQVAGELLTVLNGISLAIEQLVKSLGMSLPDANGRVRVSVDAMTGTLTLTSLTTLSTLTNQTQIGGYPCNDQVPSLMNIAAKSLRNQIVVS